MEAGLDDASTNPGHQFIMECKTEETTFQVHVKSEPEDSQHEDVKPVFTTQSAGCEEYIYESSIIKTETGFDLGKIHSGLRYGTDCKIKEKFSEHIKSEPDDSQYEDVAPVTAMQSEVCKTISETEPRSEPSVKNNHSYVDQQQYTIDLQKYYSGHNKNSKKSEWTNEKIKSVIKLIDDYNLAIGQGRRPSNKQYHHAKKYDIMTVGNEKALIMKRKSHSAPVVQIIPSSEYYHLIHDTHIATGHGRRDKIVHALKNKYAVPIFAITIFLQLCKTCLSKKSSPKSGIDVKPLVSDDFNRRGQVDLVDFQSSPDGEYKWLLQYEDHSTKFCFLRPLRSKEANEVAIEILKIFLEVGCPNILESDEGREFTASVLKEIVSLWPACNIVNGRPRHPQSQGSMEHSNQDVKNMIRVWMVDNNSTNWSVGCYFAQFQKNSSYHSTIAKTPFKALFGDDPRCGLSSTCLSENIISKLETEEDMENLFEVINDNKKATIVGNGNSTLDQVIISNNSDDKSPMINDELNKQNSEKNMTKTEEQDKVLVIGSKINILHQAVISNNYVAISEKLNINKSEINTSKTKAREHVPAVGREITILDKALVPGDSYIFSNTKENPMIIEEVNILMCHICKKEASGAHTCLRCKNVTHAICGMTGEDEDYGSQLICNLCENEINTVRERNESHMNLKRAAKRMAATSFKKFKDIDVTLSVEVPKVDRGPLDSKNVIGKAIQKKNELYRVSTGIINDWIPQNLVFPTPGTVLSDDIPEVTFPSITISAMTSSFDGQRMKQCNCKKDTKGQCLSNRCNCKKANVLCSSRCHKPLTCNNK